MLPYVLIGNVSKAAPIPGMTANTFAPDVDPQLMELRNVLKCRKLRALTPYHPEVWEHYLKAAGLMHKLGHII